MDLYVGQSALRGEFGRYARKLNFLELTAEPSSLPKVAKLATYRAQAPSFVFSVVLSPRCFSEDQAEATRALEYGLGVARALEPKWLILRTPPVIHPGPAGLRRIEQVLAKLPSGSHQLAWEARGLWESSAARVTAARLGVTPVLDLSDASKFGDVPLSGSCYARLLAIGTAQRPGEGLLIRFLERVLACNEVFIAVDGAPALPVRQSLDVLLADLASDDSDLDDDELDHEGGEADGSAKLRGEEEE